MTKHLHCTYCGKELEKNETEYIDNIGFCHIYCHQKSLQNEQEKDDLVDTIIEQYLLKNGRIREYYGGTYQHQHITDGCHWEKLTHINKDDTWYFFNGTFATKDDTESSITARATCACGELENVEIGVMMTIPDVIQAGLELGLIDDYLQ